MSTSVLVPCKLSEANTSVGTTSYSSMDGTPAAPMLADNGEHAAQTAQQPDSAVLYRAGALMTGIFLSCLSCFAAASMCSMKYPIVLSHTALAFALGLRHAVDCDHLAAIDNVTRQLINRGQFPVSTGFWFAVGHSSVVLMMTVLLAGGYSAAMNSNLAQKITLNLAKAAACLSVCLLGGIGALNAYVAAGLFQNWCILKRQCKAQQDETLEQQQQASLVTALSALPRIKQAFSHVDRPSKMVVVGFLFGLSFDTATQVSLIGMSAMSGGSGAIPPLMVLIFPVSFSCGMCLVDTANGLLMLVAYSWATIEPINKLFYNFLVTATSAIVAICIGSLELLQIVGKQGGFKGRFWKWITDVDMGTLGYMVIGTFVVILGSAVCHHTYMALKAKAVK